METTVLPYFSQGSIGKQAKLAKRQADAKTSSREETCEAEAMFARSVFRSLYNSKENEGLLVASSF